MRPATERPRDPWFCLPVLVCMLTDAAVSLACQPAAYWWGLTGLLLLEALAFTCYWHLSTLCGSAQHPHGDEPPRPEP